MSETREEMHHNDQVKFSRLIAIFQALADETGRLSKAFNDPVEGYRQVADGETDMSPLISIDDILQKMEEWLTTTLKEIKRLRK